MPVDPHATTPTVTDAITASPGSPATTSGAADVWVQTTMPSGVSVPSSAPSSLPVGGQQDGAEPPTWSAGGYQHEPQDHPLSAPSDQAVVPVESASASASIHLGPGPVVVNSTPPSDGWATSSPADATVQPATSAHDGAWTPQATTSPGPDVAAPSSTASPSEWQAAPSPTPSSPAQGWNPVGGEAAAAAAALGPFAAASVYQATQPETFQTLRGNGTYFEASASLSPLPPSFSLSEC